MATPPRGSDGRAEHHHGLAPCSQRSPAVRGPVVVGPRPDVCARRSTFRSIRASDRGWISITVPPELSALGVFGPVAAGPFRSGRPGLYWVFMPRLHADEGIPSRSPRKPQPHRVEFPDANRAAITSSVSVPSFLAVLVSARPASLTPRASPPARARPQTGRPSRNVRDGPCVHGDWWAEPSIELPPHRNLVGLSISVARIRCPPWTKCVIVSHYSS